MHADLTKVRQILLNLLDNAAKFTRQGRITFSIARERVADGAEWICFRVADTGIGMTTGQVLDLFQPFAQADDATTREYGGSGLGLTISHRFCQMMGGEIIIESEVDRGSVFIVRLPAEVPDRQARPTLPA
jgi:signal transduction histidine kinase